MNVILIFVIIFLIILLFINNKKENFNTQQIIRYYPLRSFNTSIINNSSPVELSNYFGLKNSDNSDIKYYLLYNKYIDLMNKLINSKLLSNLQELNTKCGKLNMKILSYLYCKSIYPSNTSNTSNTSNKNYIEYTNNYLNLIMINNNNVFRLDDKLKKAVLIYKLPYNLNNFIDREQFIKKYSKSINIGITSSEYTSIVNYMNSFKYGTNITSRKDFLLSMAAIIYNYYIKYFNHATISLNNIYTNNNTINKGIAKLKAYKHSTSSQTYTKFMSKYNSNNASLSLSKKLESNNLKSYLRGKINPANLDLSSGDGIKPHYPVNLDTLELENLNKESVFNNLLSHISILNTKLESLEYTHTSYLNTFNQLNGENLSKFICTNNNDTNSYTKYKG